MGSTRRCSRRQSDKTTHQPAGLRNVTWSPAVSEDSGAVHIQRGIWPRHGVRRLRTALRLLLATTGTMAVSNGFRIGRIEKMTASASGSVSPGLTNGEHISGRVASRAAVPFILGSLREGP